MGSLTRVNAEVLSRVSVSSAAEQNVRLLAIDTALGTSVAVNTAEQVYEASSDDPFRHAEVIGDLMQRVLCDAALNPPHLTAVVAGVGPGPFTGLRVGIAAARACAVGLRVAVLPVHSHDAVALAVLEQGATHRVRVVQDARRKELFVTEYEGLDWSGVPQCVTQPYLVPRTEFVASAADVWPERIPAASLLRVASRKLLSGQSFVPDAAVYLRAPDVKQPGAPKRVTG